MLVVERGSFARAAMELFVSSNALIKQINILERDLGVTLLVRTNQGVEVTQAGQYVYDRAKEMIAESRRVIREAQRIASTEKRTVRIFTSPMRPIKRIRQIWEQADFSQLNIDLEVVQIPDDDHIWGRLLGEGDFSSCDVFVTIKPDTPEGLVVLEHSIVQEAYTSPQICAVPAGHRLRGKRSIYLEDLHGESIWLVKNGSTSTANALRDLIVREHPQIRIMDYRPYQISDLNRIARSSTVAVISAEWADVHPSLECIPLEGNWADVVCLLCKKDADAHVRQFVDAFREIVSMNQA